MDARDLRFCEDTTRAALEVLRRRLDLGGAEDPRPRLAVDVTGEAVAALPGSLTLTAVPRPADR